MKIQYRWHISTEVSKELLISSHKAVEDVRNTDDILTMINRVTVRINLLRVNVAIEADWAGEKGKGFEVVTRRETVSAIMIRNTSV